MGTPLPKTNIKCPVVVGKSHMALVPGRARFTGLNLDRFDECRIMQRWVSFPSARPGLDLRRPCPSRPVTLILTDTSFRCRPIPEGVHFGRWAMLRIASHGSSFAALCCHLIKRETLKIKSTQFMSLHVLLDRSFLSVWPWSTSRRGSCL